MWAVTTDLTADETTDHAAIQGMVDAFFGAFVSGPGCAERMDLLRGLLLPVAGRVEVFGDIAHWFGGYAKAGTQEGEPFTGRGMKTIQLVRTADGWRISAAAWDDEREGLTLPTDAG